MQRVQITLLGKQVMVDQDMVKKMLKKNELVKSAQRFQAEMSAVPCEAEHILQKQLQEIMKKIICLNRTIRRNVTVI